MYTIDFCIKLVNKASSSAIAETARVTYLLPASFAYWYDALQCADAPDLPMTSK